MNYFTVPTSIKLDCRLLDPRHYSATKHTFNKFAMLLIVSSNYNLIKSTQSMHRKSTMNAREKDVKIYIRKKEKEDLHNTYTVAEPTEEVALCAFLMRT